MTPEQRMNEWLALLERARELDPNNDAMVNRFGNDAGDLIGRMVGNDFAEQKRLALVVVDAMPEPMRAERRGLIERLCTALERHTRIERREIPPPDSFDAAHAEEWRAVWFEVDDATGVAIREVRPPAIFRPVTFSAPMVRAITTPDRTRKTVTRRVVTTPTWSDDAVEEMELDGGKLEAIARSTGCLADVRCPLGAAGDGLYVCEPWACPRDRKPATSSTLAEVLYTSRMRVPLRPSYVGKSGRFMPRKFSRLSLVIESVRAERLLDITPDDVACEGIAGWMKGRGSLGGVWKYAPPDIDGDGPLWPWDACPTDPVEAYLKAWDELHRDDAHKAARNPLVWRVEFKVFAFGYPIPDNAPKPRARLIAPGVPA